MSVVPGSIFAKCRGSLYVLGIGVQIRFGLEHASHGAMVSEAGGARDDPKVTTKSALAAANGSQFDPDCKNRLDPRIQFDTLSATVQLCERPTGKKCKTI